MKPLALLMTLVVVAPVARAADWPHWRGPGGDAIVRDEKLGDKWPDALKPLWTAQVGLGYASPVAKDGKVYLFSNVNQQDTLMCFDAAKGHVLWKQSNAGGWTGDRPGTRATPWIDADRIYTYGGGGDLIARNLADGKQVWLLNILKETKAGNLGWGVASSPLVEGDSIYAQGGQGGPIAVCVNKATGKFTWQSEKGIGGYAPPILIDVDGTKQLIVFAGKALMALNPTDGKTIWTQPWETSYDVNAATPVYSNHHLFITSGYGHGGAMFKLSATAAEKLWETKKVRMQVSSPILDAGHLYASDEDGAVRCLKWPEQQILWQAKDKSLNLGTGPFIRYQDKLITFSDRAMLSLVKATPEGIEKISQINLGPSSEQWTIPMVSDGKLYVKVADKFLCFDISGK